MSLALNLSLWKKKDNQKRGERLTGDWAIDTLIKFENYLARSVRADILQAFKSLPPTEAYFFTTTHRLLYTKVRDVAAQNSEYIRQPNQVHIVTLVNLTARRLLWLFNDSSDDAKELLIFNSNMRSTAELTTRWIIDHRPTHGLESLWSGGDIPVAIQCFNKHKGSDPLGCPGPENPTEQAEDYLSHDILLPDDSFPVISSQQTLQDVGRSDRTIPASVKIVPASFLRRTL